MPLPKLRLPTTSTRDFGSTRWMAPATTSAALAVLPSIRIASLGAPATAVPSATRVCGGSVMLWVDTITPWSMNTRAVATASFSRPPRLPRRSRITPRVWSAAARFTSRRMSWADPSTKAGTRMYSNRWPPLPIRRAVTRVTRTGWRSSVSSSGAAAPGRWIESCTAVPGLPCIRPTASR